MISGPSSLDTSVVVRLLVGDPVPLFRCATQLIEGQEAVGAAVHVSDHVLAEAYFALQSYYKIPKSDALEMLADFIRCSGVTVTPIARAVLALPNLASAKPGFVDRLIHGASHASGHTLVTFERAAKKFPATVVLAVT
ncbi:MAG: PIN domain-containing protein [Verrucomicrobiota bacterium]